MGEIIIVDTSILMNILDVPGFNQKRDEVHSHLERVIEKGEKMLLPMAAIFEAGNHIAQLSGGRVRRKYASTFADQVRKALEGAAPWVLTPMPDARQLGCWMEGFPDFASRGVGMAGLSILKVWEATCVQHPRRRVRVWSLDKDLAGYDRRP